MKAVSVIDHTDHCIDLVRSFVQCHASASVMTYQWVPGTEVPLGNYEVDNVCVDWGYYQSWVTDRALKGETLEEIGHGV